MKRGIAALGIIMLLVLAASVAGGYPAPGFSQVSLKKPDPQLFAPTISIIQIKIAPAAPGNNEPVTVGVKVKSAFNQEDICGLNETNFKLETITVPPGGAAVIIEDVFATSSTAVNQPIDCNFWLNLAPTWFQGQQYTWLTGTYTVKLWYVRDGKQISSEIFSFRV